MHAPRLAHAPFALALAIAASVPLAAAQPGMWLPSQLPDIADDLRASGLGLDPAAISDLTGQPMGAIVSLKGCSGSFVSPDGLIATNHHCVFAALQNNATPEKDLITDGFLARRREDEIPARPDARVLVTTGFEDVTAKVLPAAEAKLADAERWKRVERHRRELVAACEKGGGMRCEVRSFFGGEKFLLTRALEIRDVRLVYAPALGVGNFGDEVDNWMWPRHTGDFGFYRAYVGPDGRPAAPSPRNVPYHPAHWLKIATGDLDPGDFVMVVGYPGTTHRLDSAEEIRDAQEFELPTSIRYRQALLAVLRAAGEKDHAVEIRNASRIASLENYLKKHQGTLVALERDGLAARKAEEEKAVAAWFAGQPGGAERHAALVAELDRVLAAERATRQRDTVLEWLDTASPMLAQAQKLVRIAENRARPDLDREEGYQDRDREDLAAAVRRAQAQIEPASDRAGLRIFLLEATKLPAGQRIEALDRALAGTGAASPEAQVDAFLERLYAGTKMADLATRQGMLDAPPAELAKSGDTMIALARELWPLHESLRDRDAALDGALLRVRPQLVAGLRAVRGGKLAPDANSTLRVIYGNVEGYAPRDAIVALPQTTIAGVLEKDTGVRPFDSPKKLLAEARAGNFGAWVDPDLAPGGGPAAEGSGGTLPVDFLSTCSVTNGSSGSATLDARGDFRGLAFDANIEAVAADYLFDPRWTRTVHVDSRYMLWVMEHVDGAVELMREMGVEPGAGAH